MNEFYLSFGNFILENFGAVKAFVFCLMTSVTFLALIPTMFKTYASWKENRKPTVLSFSIILGAFAVILLATTYPMFVDEVIKLNNAIESGIVKTVIVIGLFMSSFYISLPRMIHYYQKLKEIKAVRSFSLMCFFAFISFYILSVLFVPILRHAIAIAD